MSITLYSYNFWCVWWELLKSILLATFQYAIQDCKTVVTVLCITSLELNSSNNWKFVPFVHSYLFQCPTSIPGNQQSVSMSLVFRIPHISGIIWCLSFLSSYQMYVFKIFNGFPSLQYTFLIHISLLSNDT